jgi:hypothetical protein
MRNRYLGRGFIDAFWRKKIITTKKLTNMFLIFMLLAMTANVMLYITGADTKWGE